MDSDEKDSDEKDSDEKDSDEEEEIWREVSHWGATLLITAAIAGSVVAALNWARAKDSARHFTCQSEGAVLVQTSRLACQQAWDEGEIALYNPTTGQCCYTGQRR